MFSRSTRSIVRKITYDVSHSTHRDIDGFKNEIVRTLDNHIKSTEVRLDAHMASTNRAIDAYTTSTNRVINMMKAMIGAIAFAGGTIAVAGYHELDNVKKDVAEIKQLIIEQNRRRWF